MPEWLHKQLAASAKKKGLSGDRFNAYVYGTLQKYEKAHESARKTALKKKLGG